MCKMQVIAHIISPEVSFGIPDHRLIMHTVFLCLLVCIRTEIDDPALSSRVMKEQDQQTCILTGRCGATRGSFNKDIHDVNVAIPW